MARTQSPGYPQFALPKAISSVEKIFSADRRNPIDRATATKHIGYSGPSGAADKALATLAHYGLVERTGKGELRVSQLAVDIIHPDKPDDRKRALYEAGFRPQIFKDLRERFGDHVSESALQSYLVRENFLDRAIAPVSKAFLETSRYLEQEKASESGSNASPKGGESILPDADLDSVVYGGAKVGDLIQWEVGGALQMEQPMRVRLVSEDGQHVAVEGSETGIPMEQVIVEERAALPPTPAPIFKLDQKKDETALPEGWKEERLLDDGGGEIFIRYEGEPSAERYTFIRDYLDFKLGRMKK